MFASVMDFLASGDEALINERKQSANVESHSFPGVCSIMYMHNIYCMEPAHSES